MKILVLNIILLAFIQNSLSFLPTRLNYDDNILKDIFCPDQMGIYPSNLKAITREGIRREVRNLFNEDPPAGADPSFNIPDTASLSEMFHQYYGDEASPTRFYKAVNTIAWANAELDSFDSTRYDPKYSFDDEQFLEGQELISAKYSSIVLSILSNQSYDFARQQIGQALHGIQDFYSGSNWFELGNTDPLADLGLPSLLMPNLAGRNDATCTECSSEDGCLNNVITSSNLLTSGYYEYNATASSSFIIEKPVNKGKCSFGGSLDSSRSQSSIGGINKESSSPCFSPHYASHFDVTEIAMQATQHYLSVIRAAIGNEKFRYLFDLYQGSALVIVIDITGSMSSQIEAVKEEVNEIITETPADLYILVTFLDNDYGPVVKTTDSDYFNQTLQAIDIGQPPPGEQYSCLIDGDYGPGKEECAWGGMQLGLINAPDYSVLYLFTDSGGKDYQLMDGDFALAQQKNAICTVVWHYSGPDTGSPYTTKGDYERLVQETGGAFIYMDDFNIDEIIPILSQGIESSEVTLAIRYDISGNYLFEATVDDTVISLDVTISITGALTTGTIESSGGHSYDILDSSSLDADSSVTVNVYSNTIISLSFPNPQIGQWIFNLDSTFNYSITVEAKSPLGYMNEFTTLDTRPPRPNYSLISGQPITGFAYYIETTLVGWIENKVTSVTNLDFIDEKGVVLSSVSSTEPVDDEFYILSSLVPDVPFYVSVNGTLFSGNRFIRIDKTMVIPSEISVEVDLSVSNLAGYAGTNFTASFDVFNFGADATYDYYATDDQGFVVDFNPKSSSITTNGSDAITLSLSIPADASPWTQSTIVVTASSESNSFNQNSDIAHCIVLPEGQDLEPPTCTTNSVPDCSGFQSSSNCDQSTWTATAVLQDNGSGMQSIYTQPSGSNIVLVTDPFTPGTNQSIQAAVNASCCVTQLAIIGQDGFANVGECDYDMGELDGVIVFEVIDEGSTWIYLRWIVSSVRTDLLFYEVIRDEVFKSDVPCGDLVCYFNSTNLKSCDEYLYSLVPYFDEFGNGTFTTGSTSHTRGKTLESEPLPPYGATVTSDSDTSTVNITWFPPVEDDCVLFYEVCYYPEDSPETVICDQTTTTYISLDNLQACTVYEIDITSNTKSGYVSAPYVLNFDGFEGIPGPVTNLTVDSIDAVSAKISWDAPTINPQCVDGYDVSSTDAASYEHKIFDRVVDSNIAVPFGEFFANVGPLLPCKNYTFIVVAFNKDDEDGPPSSVNSATDELDPQAPTDVTANSNSVDSIDVSWSQDAFYCTSYYEVCYKTVADPNFVCTDVYNSTSYTIEGLEACTRYDIEVTAVSESGLRSSSVYAAASTDDEAPGDVENLTIISTTSSSILISYDPPTSNPQCVAAYDQQFTDLNLTNFQNMIKEVEEDVHLVSPYITSNTSGLPACTTFLIEVWAISPQGLVGPKANTTGSTDSIPPSAPRFLQTTSTTTSSISISWETPEDDSLCIDHFSVIWIDAQGFPQNTIVAAMPGRDIYQYTIEGLVSCSEYSIYVEGRTANNVAGAEASLLPPFNAPSTQC